MQSRQLTTTEALALGFGAGIVGSYVLYRLATTQNGMGYLKRIFTSSRPPTGMLNSEIAFQYGDRQSYIAYPAGPSGALGFVSRCAVLCEKYTRILQDFTGEKGESTCLDIGCSVGATTMELSKIFTHVMGIDASSDRIAIGQTLKLKGTLEYTLIKEGNIQEEQSVLLDPLYELEGVRFMVADPCQLPQNLVKVDCALSTLALERMRRPKKFLEALPRLVNPSGTVVIVSPYNWDPSITSETERLGGKLNEEGKSITAEEELKQIMTQMGFELRHEENLPVPKRESARVYQWHVAHATVWEYSSTQSQPCQA